MKKYSFYFLLFLSGCIFMNNALAVNENLVSTLKNMSSNNPAIIIQAQVKQNNNAHFAFILFYMHSCPHCQRFDPVLKNFSLQNNIPVLAYTLDGQSLPSFPDSFSPNQAELLKFFPDKNPVVPTLFLMDEEAHKIYPVLQGEATMNQLSMRFSQISNAVSHQSNAQQNTEKQQDFSYAQNN